MDLSALAGIIAGAFVIALSLPGDEAAAAFANLHGIGIVFGGTFSAAMVNSAPSDLLAAARASLSLLRARPYPLPDALLPVLAGLVEQARRGGVRSLTANMPAVADGGFMARAVDVALSSEDMAAARTTLESDINQMRDRHRKVDDLLRTLATLAPMFGLLGTIIGIVAVLGNISRPEAIAQDMRVAVATAFYGILLSNLLFIPLAGRLRSRSLEELLSREMTLEGVVDAVFTGRVPVVSQLRLRSFVESRRAAVR